MSPLSIDAEEVKAHAPLYKIPKDLPELTSKAEELKAEQCQRQRQEQHCRVHKNDRTSGFTSFGLYAVVFIQEWIGWEMFTVILGIHGEQTVSAQNHRIDSGSN